jgi:hypothetical protein
MVLSTDWQMAFIGGTLIGTKKRRRSLALFIKALGVTLYIEEKAQLRNSADTNLYIEEKAQLRNSADTNLHGYFESAHL